MTHPTAERSIPSRLPARQDWPLLTRTPARAVVLTAVAVLGIAWTLVLTIDVLDVAGLGEATYRTMWHHLFDNSQPIEWLQWLTLGSAALLYGYVAGRLHGSTEPGVSAFFLVFGFGLALMLIEDAGDVRHVIARYVERHLGTEVLGTSYRVATEVPYFALLASVPLYAVLRYGRSVWRRASIRPYLATAVVLYAVASVASAFRHHRELYVRMGRWIDESLLGGAWPPVLDMSTESAQFFLMDSLIEESIELLAAACLLAVPLAYLAEHQAATAPRTPLARRRSELNRPIGAD